MKKSNENHIQKKIAITVPAVILLLALYALIFGFSAQDAEESGSLSRKISEETVIVLNSLLGNDWSQPLGEDPAQYFEHPIRKLAHFSEYACMGVLLYLIWVQWVKQNKKLCVLIVAWVFLSGALDELHQKFVPGRWCSFADVCLDTCGGIFGLLLCLCVSRLIRRFRKTQER